ncbi:DUF1697 domain-containing protein [Rothia dentocariosa]|jgi:hypothetical protein|uniref:DUF1697 domain-containing protein n=1 Tax=Rothia dentocariosa TaxID=2047 RepID=A0A2A8D6L7_9MICC|nr:MULTISPECIES: DUF1697 domain-containing protein [Rothia]OFR97955.1 hypothetical protein HMPREF2756_07965 [Rothia sp. HMSC067H10]PEN16625.1 DUF1697 domain-containing protein [Rothia dentocariosa]
MHVVFYRNLNLGHSGSPNREQLETALLDAGAKRVRSFQTNGTVLIEANNPADVVAKAERGIRDASGYEDAAFVRNLADLEKLLALGVFEKYPSPRTYRETVTFFKGDRTPSWPLPWTNHKDDVDVLFVDDGIALSLIRKPRNSAGSPTYEIEREIGGIATTRNRGTLERLLKAASQWG